MEVAYKVGNTMVRQRKNTEEYLNPWAGEAGWKTDPRQFNVISGAQAAPERRIASAPRNFKKPDRRKSLIPFNWMQMATIVLGLVAVSLMVSLGQLLLG